MDKVELLSIVALLRELPDHALVRGQVGTVVEDLGAGMYLVEFSDGEGRTYALAPVRTGDLIRLHHGPLEQVA